jgi:hypothetical protein
LALLGPATVSAGSDGRSGGTSRFANGASPVGGPGNTPLGNGTTASPQFSGNITVDWWPEALTLPYTGPVTPEQAAWTDKGKWPTLIFAGLVAAPEIPDLAGAEVLRDNLHFDGPTVRDPNRIGQIQIR